ncbi:MAG TPA: PAS domain S-box protein [Ignavibacteriaceae bacterium]|nr:PAS domain S-box protein [Ignavibacteriaceae bacterium]
MENEQIQKLLDINPEPAFIVDKQDGNIVFYNEIFSQTLLLPVQVTHNIFEIISPVDQGKILTLLESIKVNQKIQFGSFYGETPINISAISFDENNVLLSFNRLAQMNNHQEGIKDIKYDSGDISGRKYKLLFEEIPIPVIIYKEDDYSILAANNAVVNAIGYSSEEFLHLKLPDLISDWKNQLNKNGKVSLKNKSGEIIYFEYSTSVLIYNGYSAKLITLNDITEKRKVEEKFYDSSVKLKTIINNLPVAIIELDENGRFILQEGDAVRMAGFDGSELAGRSILDIAGDVLVTMHDGKDIPITRVISMVMQGSMIAGHASFRGKNYEIYFAPLRKNNKTPDGLLGICLDITEKIKVEKSFRETEERFRLIAEKTSDLISMVSNKEYLYLSPSYETKFGYTFEELKKFGPLTLVHPDDKPLLIDWRNKGMVEFRVRNKNGEWIWMEAESFSILGDPEIIVGIGRDITKNKMAQQALKESEERYRILFERNPLPMFVYDEETYEFLAINEAAISHYGYTKDEFLHMNIKDIRPGDDVPALMELFSKHRSGMMKSGIWRHKLKNGCIINVDITSYNIIFNGRPARIVLANDVTAKLKAEKALEESEKKYRGIVENANEGIWLFDENWNITFVNKKLSYILGYKIKEIVNRSVFKFIDNKDRDNAKKHFHKGVKETIKLRLMHKDGTERWVISNAVSLFSEDSFTGTLALVTDITSEMRVQESLQHTSEMLQALINSSPLSIIILDENGRVELWNPATEKMFGWKSNEVLGQKPPFAQGEREPERERITNMVLKGNAFTGQEITRVTKDGKKINLSISASPLFDHDKRTIGIAAFLMDITERKVAEKEREKLFKEINNARKRLKVLSSKLIAVQETEKRNISRELHDEIGQLLTAIKIDLQRIKNECNTDEGCRMIDDCTSLVEKTISIVRNLSHELRPSIIDDLGLAVALKWYTDRFSQRTGIKVDVKTINIDKFLPAEDSIMLFRVCQEALTNITKHSGADHVSINLSLKKNEISLSIEDNGKGFDIKKALRNSAKGESMGILSMQERVELLSGKLKIISSEKAGTKIKVKYRV